MKEALEEIEELKSEYKRMEAKMKVTDIAEFLDCDLLRCTDGLTALSCKSKKMIDVLRYQQGK